MPAAYKHITNAHAQWPLPKSGRLFYYSDVIHRVACMKAMPSSQGKRHKRLASFISHSEIIGMVPDPTPCLVVGEDFYLGAVWYGFILSQSLKDTKGHRAE